MPDNDRIVQLLTEIKESLERQLKSLETSLGAKIDNLGTRFDDQAARLDRQGGMLSSGQRQLVRQNEWAETMDTNLEAKDKQIADLLKRIEVLEKKTAHLPAA